MGSTDVTARLAYLLELNGKLAGRFFQFAGGGAEGDVIEDAGVGGKIHKHLGGVRYQDMDLNCGTGMSHAFYDWIGSAFGGSPKRQSGAVIGLDLSSKPKGRLEFFNALVTSLELPKLDRASNGKATMEVKIAPERTSFKKGDESQNLGVYASALPKAWKLGSFRIQIDGLNKECAHVTGISSLRMGRSVKPEAVGTARDADLEAAGSQFSNIDLVIPGRFADGFYKWYDDAVVKGNTSEKKGSVDFLAPGSSSPYFSVDLGGLGISGMSSQGGRMNTAGPATVSLYCEEMTFSTGAAAIK